MYLFVSLEWQLAYLVEGDQYASLTVEQHAAMQGRDVKSMEYVAGIVINAY